MHVFRPRCLYEACFYPGRLLRYLLQLLCVLLEYILVLMQFTMLP